MYMINMDKSDKYGTYDTIRRAYNEEFYTTTNAKNANSGNSNEGFAALKSMIFL